MIFAILRIPKLVDKELYPIRRRSHKAHTPQMAHLLPIFIVDAVGEVDGVIEQRGLGCRGRDDGDRVLVQQQHLHLRRTTSTRCAVPGTDHFSHVAGDGLEDVHGELVMLGWRAEWCISSRAASLLRYDVNNHSGVVSYVIFSNPAERLSSVTVFWCWCRSFACDDAILTLLMQLYAGTCK